MVIVLIIVFFGLMCGILFVLADLNLVVRAMAKLEAGRTLSDARRIQLERENHERIEGLAMRDIARFQDEGRSLD